MSANRHKLPNSLSTGSTTEVVRSQRRLPTRAYIRVTVEMHRLISSKDTPSIALRSCPGMIRCTLTPKIFRFPVILGVACPHACVLCFTISQTDTSTRTHSRDLCCRGDRCVLQDGHGHQHNHHHRRAHRVAYKNPSVCSHRRPVLHRPAQHEWLEKKCQEQGEL